VVLRTIECKECNQSFKYEFDINELRGSRKKYCDKCKNIRKQIVNRESKRVRVYRTSSVNEKITKQVVIDDAIKLILDLNKYSNVTEKSTETYNKILGVLPDNYVTRDALRRQYRDVLLKK